MRFSSDWCSSSTKRVSIPTHLGGVIMGTLIAFPAATVDPSDTWQTQLALIDLEGLVFHHAPSVSPASRALTSHRLQNILWKQTKKKHEMLMLTTWLQNVEPKKTKLNNPRNKELLEHMSSTWIENTKAPCFWYKNQPQIKTLYPSSRFQWQLRLLGAFINIIEEKKKKGKLNWKELGNRPSIEHHIKLQWQYIYHTITTYVGQKAACRPHLSLLCQARNKGQTKKRTTGITSDILAKPMYLQYKNQSMVLCTVKHVYRAFPIYSLLLFCIF